MPFYLGVDGGKSSTKALIGDETGRVIGSGAGGPCNHVAEAEGRERLRRAVIECVSGACQQAGIDAGHVKFEAACVGMSGGPADKQGILAEILRARNLVVTDDMVIALSGATGGEPGVAAYSGTGSFAFARNAAGETARAGGWGYVFGDEGSGFDIVRQAVRAMLRYEEGWGPSTALYPALLEAGVARKANDLLHRFYTPDWPRPRVASLARIVDSVALSGDPVAGDILAGAAQQLATLAVTAGRRVFPAPQPVLVCSIGGVFRSRLLSERFRQLVELDDGVHAAAPRYSPAAGALIEAYRAAGMHPALSGVPE